ncbi:23S rRNA (uracil(1939)-C(5))-methyltransferase RlmD [Larsenimonas salina]|uniref:23S rRNA (uracil(1939)-C(5))-methyltransferase RlmD n=1 Tax=Larsenimonas salina TaxID=1295565 RepID=UPI00207381F0|nr:23S rRNA (uracil(1939)-C(5))-methyltransferase RlmD [Larsenimonas salina]
MARLGQKRASRSATRRVLESRSAHEQGETEGVIERLSYEGRGVTRSQDGKAVFVERTLPGERVVFAVHTSHRRFDEAHPKEILAASLERVEPMCVHFGICGGCDLQHAAIETQRRHKLKTLRAHFEQQRIDAPEPLLIAGAEAGYRRRARLGVRVNRDGEVLLGYRRRGSDRLFAITECPVLVPALEALISPLRECITQLEHPRHVGHIQLNDSDQGVEVSVRLMKRVPEDLEHLNAFACAEGISLSVVVGRDTPSVECINGEAEHGYTLTLDGLDPVSLAFGSGDFVQVNMSVNQQMVDRLVDWCGPLAQSIVVDLFAGIGNFSLPLARLGARVHAFEGQQSMVTRLLDNARVNGLDSHIEGHVADLSRALRAKTLASADLVVLDPPRAGAEAIARQLAEQGPDRIVYIACDPATLARDVAHLCEGGYRVVELTVADMFPQTAHLETMVLLER